MPIIRYCIPHVRMFACLLACGLIPQILNERIQIFHEDTENVLG